MNRYGYLDMDEHYTDIGDYNVVAVCENCGKQVTTLHENCWEDDRGELVTDCMCSEDEEQS